VREGKFLGFVCHCHTLTHREPKSHLLVSPIALSRTRAAARPNRLCVLACPDEADTYKARARYWLAMARKATRPPLP
jgi:hypothetical protein